MAKHFLLFYDFKVYTNEKQLTKVAIKGTLAQLLSTNRHFFSTKGQFSPMIHKTSGFYRLSMIFYAWSKTFSQVSDNYSICSTKQKQVTDKLKEPLIIKL